MLPLLPLMELPCSSPPISSIGFLFLVILNVDLLIDKMCRDIFLIIHQIRKYLSSYHSLSYLLWRELARHPYSDWRKHALNCMEYMMCVFSGNVYSLYHAPRAVSHVVVVKTGESIQFNKFS